MSKPSDWEDHLRDAEEAAEGEFTEDNTVSLEEIRIEVERLAKLDKLAYEAERAAVAKRLGIRASVLDDAVAKARPKGPIEAEAVETLERWPEPVNGVSLAEEIRDRLRAHVVFANATDADALAVWALGTFLMDVWRLWPKVLITSPTKRCGKSTLLEALEALVFRGMMCSNITSAALFRSIEKWRPTLILDEADRFLRDKDELNGIINAGHTRRTAYVNRCVEVNGEQDVRRFSVWGAQIFASIGGQADTLTDRSLVVALQRKMKGDPAERLPFDLHERMSRLRRQAQRWSEDNAKRIAASTSEPPASGNDRRRDNFTPLWRIAEALGGPWPARIKAAYAAQASVGDDDQPAGEMLLEDVVEIFNRRGGSVLSSMDLLNDLNAMDERPWSEWNKGRMLSTHQLSRMLKQFGVRSKGVRIGPSTPKGYRREDVWSAFCRYSGPKSATPQQDNEFSDLGAQKTATPSDDVAVSNQDNPLKNNKCCGVADFGSWWPEYEAKNDPNSPEAW